jgi:hypothetical protein
MSVLLALALQLSPAAGADFHGRVTEAKLAEGAAAGAAYQKQLWDRISTQTTDAYKACVNSNKPTDKGPFTLVANVLPDGRLAQIDVQPQTAVAQCMAGQFASWMVPAPPAQPKPYPIEIDFSIAK